MKRLGLVVFSLVLAIGMLVGAQGVAKADYILDFSTGVGGWGGTITLSGSQAVGTDIRLSQLDVIDLATNTQTIYAVTSFNGTTLQNYGLLDFNTYTSTIEVWGNVTGLTSATSNLELLNGTLDSAGYIHTSNGIMFVASGPDTKDLSLLAALGIPASTTWYMSGVVTTANGPQAGSTADRKIYTAYSTDLSNNGTTVPVPRFSPSACPRPSRPRRHQKETQGIIASRALRIQAKDGRRIPSVLCLLSTTRSVKPVETSFRTSEKGPHKSTRVIDGFSPLFCWPATRFPT